METKKCSKCHEVKPLDDFYKAGPLTIRRATYCKPCYLKRSKIRADRRKECQPVKVVKVDKEDSKELTTLMAQVRKMEQQYPFVKGGDKSKSRSEMTTEDRAIYSSYSRLLSRVAEEL